jgi:hypothetical protein
MPTPTPIAILLSVVSPVVGSEGVVEGCSVGCSVGSVGYGESDELVVTEVWEGLDVEDGWEEVDEALEEKPAVSILVNYK